MTRQVDQTKPCAQPGKQNHWRRRGLFQTLFLLMSSSCAALSLDARTETTTELPTEKILPACGRLPGTRTPDGKQVQKLGPYPEYGESNESLEDACRKAEDKAATSSDFYISEYQSANWVCKKTIERSQRERYVTIWQCGVSVEIFCEYALNCRT